MSCQHGCTWYGTSLEPIRIWLFCPHCYQCYDVKRSVHFLCLYCKKVYCKACKRVHEEGTAEYYRKVVLERFGLTKASSEEP